MYLYVTHDARAHNDPGLEKVWRGRFAVKVHLDAFCDMNCRDQNMLADVRFKIILKLLITYPTLARRAKHQVPYRNQPSTAAGLPRYDVFHVGMCILRFTRSQPQ